MAHFLKPPTAGSAHYVLNSSGDLTKLEVPLGGTVVVHIWGGDGRGNPLRVSSNGNLVSIHEESYTTVANWTYSWTVRGNLTGSGKLLGLSIDDSVWAELPFQVTAIDPNHNWGEPQPAAITTWILVHQNIPEVRFLGIMREPGHEDHSEGRAVDLGLNASSPSDVRIADGLITLLLMNSNEIGWSYFIWNRQIWYRDARGGPNVYEGKSPHTDHIHVSWSRENSQRRFFPHFLTGLQLLREKLDAGPEPPRRGPNL